MTSKDQCYQNYVPNLQTTGPYILVKITEKSKGVYEHLKNKMDF